MASTNRPYVDPVTEPGDAGTEPWADDPKAGDQTKRGPLADPVAPSEDDAAIDGSPADQFITEDAISARNEDPDRSKSK